MWETHSVFHISMPHFLQQDGLRRRWSVSQRRMRPHRVVVHPPLFDHHLRLLQRVEDLSIQALVSQLAVEAFAVPVLPGTSWFDVQRSRSQASQPLPQLLRYELRTVVRSNILWNSALEHHIGQRFDDLITPESSSDSNRQALPRGFIDHR